MNVGCIPKKLFHFGSLLNEAFHKDAAFHGIEVGSQNGVLAETSTKVHWKVLRENIQNYIRGLNFKYRVRLRKLSRYRGTLLVYISTAYQ